MVPYSGTIRPRVVRFDQGHTVIRLDDRRRVRNHLRSIHAIALANLGELSTGLALVGSLGSETRGILLGLEVEYLKKARGTVEAEARCGVPTVRAPVDMLVEAKIRDQEGDVVAVTRARWRLAPLPARSSG
jgi:acyl-coenzyme A thioesterase PaaI-like protein